MEISRHTILARLREAKPDIMLQYPVRRLALFGSFARGDSSPDSDIDILVEVEPQIGLGFVSLADYLETLLEHKVDLVSRRAVRPALWKYIEPDLIDV